MLSDPHLSSRRPLLPETRFDLLPIVGPEGIDEDDKPLLLLRSTLLKLLGLCCTMILVARHAGGVRRDFVGAVEIAVERLLRLDKGLAGTLLSFVHRRSLSSKR